MFPEILVKLPKFFFKKTGLFVKFWLFQLNESYLLKNARFPWATETLPEFPGILEHFGMYFDLPMSAEKSQGLFIPKVN